MVFSTLLLSPSLPGTELTIHFIDVGHGDATLIQYQGKNMLIDAGSDKMGATVAEYLQKSGVRTLDIIVASHPDLDHIGGMRDVIKEFTPGLYVDNGEEKDKNSYEKLMKYLEKKEIQYMVGRAGMVLPFNEGISITITSPEDLGDDMDENSLCILLSHGSLSYFFPGDCETCDADAEVVKLAHHGSKGAAKRALLAGKKPNVVIISVEEDKDNSLPAPSTIKALKDEGIEIHQTSTEGTIILHADGTRYWFS